MSATVRMRGDGAWIRRDPQGLLRRAVERVMFTVADVLTSASPPMTLQAAISRISPRPVLVIAGEPGDEGAAARWMAAAAPASTQVWLLPDTPHTEGLRRHREAWITRVTAFLDATL